MNFENYLLEVKHPILDSIIGMYKSEVWEKEFFITNEKTFKHAQFCLSKLVNSEYLSIIRRPRQQKFKLRILAKAKKELKSDS